MGTVPLLLSLVCVALLLFAAVHDVIARTIPDLVPLGILAVALVLNLLSGSLLLPLAVAAVVAAVCLLLYWLGLMGGGDVKLLIAIAFLLPPAEVPAAALAIAIAGGGLAALFLLLRPRLRERRLLPAGRSAPLLRRASVAELWRIRRGGPLPYAVAISAGTLFTMISSGWMLSFD
jgi:prepilin peptidase CpaA